MANLPFSAPALTFQQTTFDLVEHADGGRWLRYPQIGEALGYAKARRLVDIYNSNAAEFTDRMTALVKLPTAGGVQEVRIFSLRGALLLGMFARTARAEKFRRWMLDVLEQEAQAPLLPAPPSRTPALVGQTFERVVAERDALRSMLAERVLKEEPHLRKVLYYYGINGLTHRERSTLMGWKTVGPYMDALKRLTTLGLLDYRSDERLAANGRANMGKLLAQQAAARATSAKPADPPTATPPHRLRPGNGRSAEELQLARQHRSYVKPGASNV